MKKTSLPFDVRRSKTPLLKLPVNIHAEFRTKCHFQTWRLRGKLKLRFSAVSMGYSLTILIKTIYLYKKLKMLKGVLVFAVVYIRVQSQS